MGDKQKVEFSDGSLLFVWNADSGWQNALLDSLHKWVRPDTYSCNLCRLTHGGVGPKGAWKRYVEKSNRPLVFFHRDEFENSQIKLEFPTLELPAVLLLSAAQWKVVLTAAALNRIDSLEDLLKGIETTTDSEKA